MSVNLTEQQFFSASLGEHISQALLETGMAPDLLELEVTEGMLMQGIDKALEVLNGLKKIGVRIAIDDFGVGYSSLSILKQFPLDSIKIDRAYIRDVTEDDEDKSLTDAIVAMGHKLSLTVVAQGVETKEQASFLSEHACDELQGFYFSKPVPANKIEDMLKNKPP